jgi:DNA-binding beta-propeller fold protein YncE
MRGVFAGALLAGFLLPASAMGQEIFWTDTLGRSVYTAGFDGSNPHTILTGLPEEPRSIAVDPLGRKLYLALDGNTNQVWQTNLDGTGLQIVFDIDDGPDWISLDPLAGKMYLALEDTSTIKRADFDGGNLQTLHTIPSAEFTAILVNPKHAEIYWLNEQPNQQNTVFRSSATGGAIEEFVTEPAPNQTFGNLFSLAFNPLTDHVYLLDEDDSRIYRVTRDGDIIDFLQPSLEHPRALALRPEANQMYFIDNNGIFRSDLDGQNVTPVVNIQEDGIFPLSIAVIPEPASALLAMASFIVAAFAVRRVGRSPTNSQLHKLAQP